MAASEGLGRGRRRTRRARQRFDGCWLTKHAIRIAALARALLRLRQGGQACSLRSGAALWLYRSARIQMTLGAAKTHRAHLHLQLRYLW